MFLVLDTLLRLISGAWELLLMLVWLADLLLKQMMSRQLTIELKCVIIPFQTILPYLLSLRILSRKLCRKIQSIVLQLMKFLRINSLLFLFLKLYQLPSLRALLILILRQNISRLHSLNIEIVHKLKEPKGFLRKENLLKL